MLSEYVVVGGEMEYVRPMGPLEAGDPGSWRVFVGSCERRGRYDRGTDLGCFVLTGRSRLAFRVCMPIE